MAKGNTRKADPVFDKGSPGSSSKNDKMDAHRGMKKSFKKLGS